MFNKKLIKKALTLSISFAMIMSAFVGCGKADDTTTEEVTDKESQVEYTVNISSHSMINESTDILLSRDGMIINPLTGEWIDESYANKRPVAVMINNLSAAMPQSGIGQADIIYECLVEGGITRLMAIFTDYSGLEKIGPVRSARHYYDRKAIEYDAIYAHVGQSIFAEADFDSYSQLDNLNGLYGVGNVMFYRDNSRNAPHNCYTSAEGIDKGIAYENYSVEKLNGKANMFNFKSEKSSIGGTPANKVTTAYNSGKKNTYFEYNPEDGLYYRYQNGGPQIDDQTGETLKFENVIVQFAPHSPLEAELIHIEWIGEEEGYYISNGEIIPIKWRKTDDLSVTHFYTIDGEPLKMNPGKTFVTVFPSSQKSDIIVE